MPDFVVPLRFLPDTSTLPSWFSKSQYQLYATQYGNRPNLPITFFLAKELERNFNDLVGAKANKNVLVAGTSGVGKSTLTVFLAKSFQKPTLFFNFKPNDIYLHLGLGVVDGSKALPPLGDISADDVVTAYLVAYPVLKVGMMASQVQTLLREAVENSKTWSDLLAVLGQMSEQRESRIARENLETIETRFENELLRGVSTGGWSWDFKTHSVLDLSRLIEPARVFANEIYLRYLWRKIEKEHITNFVVAIDEAHKVAIEVQNYRGIIDTFARECRSLGAAVLASSQNVADIPQDILNQFATVLLSQTIHPKDVFTVRSVHPNLIHLVGALQRYEFFDLRQDFRAGGYFDVLKLTKLVKSDEPIRWVPIEGKPISVVKPETVRPETVKPLGVSKTTPPDTRSLQRDVLRLLGSSASYVSQLGRELAGKYHKPAEKLKVDIHILLKDLVASGVVVRRELTDQFGTKRVYYWLRRKHETPYHKALIANAEAVLSERGIAAKQTRGADLVATVGGKRLAVECESGLKPDTVLKRSFVPQVRKRLEAEGFAAVWVVVPTADEKKRFGDLLKGLKRVEVLTLSDLKKKRGWKTWVR